MLRHTLPLHPPVEDSITSARRSGVKRTKSMTCEPGLFSASPGNRSHGFSNCLAIAGMAIVVK